MIYSNAHELIELLKSEHLWAQKNLGQNFLINPHVLKIIVETSSLNQEDEVLEIGPGLGILTEQLAIHAKNVTALELDRNIIPVLKKNLSQYKNVEIIHQDALSAALPQKPYKLVANIPYYITSPVINHFLQAKGHEKRPSLLVLLVQKEVAQKICSKEGDQSILSLQVQIFGKPSIASYVSKNSFFPQPKVDSAVLKIEPFSKPKISNIEIFFKLIKAAFHQKRKKISNTIPQALGLNSEESAKFFEMSRVPASIRPQAISLDGWESLIQAYEKLKN